MWTRSHVTDEVMPIDVTGPDGPITSYTVAIVPLGAPEPTTGYVGVETDGAIIAPRIQGLTARFYQAYPKIGTRTLNPIDFRLT